MFDLAADPAEEVNLVPPKSGMTEELRLWLADVRAGLRRSDDLPPPSLEDEDLEQFRALGYLDD